MFRELLLNQRKREGMIQCRPRYFRRASSDASYRYNSGMDERTARLASEPNQEPKTQDNRGWFRAGDRRINREGRPHGSKARASHECIRDCARQADRLKRLIIPERDLAWRLTRQNGPWVINLPSDYQIVDCRVDSARDSVIFIIRSNTFPRIAKGTAIPDFKPVYNGLKWRPMDSANH